MDILGIDLAKLTFDATVHTTSCTQAYQSFANTPSGFTQLAALAASAWGDTGAWLRGSDEHL